MRAKRFMPNVNSRRAWLYCAVSVLAICPTEVFAQEDGIADIIVTAQRREQSMQDVPIAVTALSQETLQTNRITNVQDLTAVAPNLSVRETAGGAGIPNFSMRGAVSYGSVAGQDKSISLYLDGVYIGSSQGSAFELPDLERIEVLRGPQGTLFGRNSTAGAISIITREPSGKFGVRQSVTYGNYDQLRSSTRVETPAFGPFSASISYTHDERKGDMRNLGAGTVWDRSGALAGSKGGVSPKTLGDRNVESVFAAVKFEPSDIFKLVYRFDWMENHFTPDGNAVVSFTPNAIGATGTPLALAYAANPFPIAGAHRPDAVNNSFTTPGYQRVQGHNLTGNLQISDNVRLKNVFAYRKSYINSISDVSGAGGLIVTADVAAAIEQVQNRPAGSLANLIGSPYVAGGTHTLSRAEQWSNETQINYESDLLTVTAGAIWFHIKTVTGAPDGLVGSTVSLRAVEDGVLPSGSRNLSFNTTESIAAYAQAEVHVTPDLDVVGGYRLTHDTKSGTSYVANTPYRFVYNDTRPSFMGGINYKPTRDLLVYAKYSTGFVSGGAVSGIAFEPETVKAWEGGFKADLLGRRLRMNLALFKASYDDLQAVSSGAFLSPPRRELGTLVLREGDLDTKGFELEVTAAPVSGLTLNGSVGYTDSKLKDVNTMLGGVDRMSTVRPKWTTSLSAQYETEPLIGGVTLMARVDGNWRDKFRAQSNRDDKLPASLLPVAYSDAMWLVNARLALRNIMIGGAKAELALWGKNLTDSDNIAQSINFGYLGSTNYTRARTYGVDLNLTF